MLCKHCQRPVYQYEHRWRHTNGLYSCAPPPPGSAEVQVWLQMPRGTRPRAEPDVAQ